MITERMQAAAKGEKKYDGLPCKNCGLTKKYTLNASCIKCSNAYAAIYVAKGRKKIKELLAQANKGKST